MRMFWKTYNRTIWRVEQFCVSKLCRWGVLSGVLVMHTSVMQHFVFVSNFCPTSQSIVLKHFRFNLTGLFHFCHIWQRLIWVHACEVTEPCSCQHRWFSHVESDLGRPLARSRLVIFTFVNNFRVHSCRWLGHLLYVFLSGPKFVSPLASMLLRVMPYRWPRKHTNPNSNIEPSQRVLISMQRCSTANCSERICWISYFLAEKLGVAVLFWGNFSEW